MPDLDCSATEKNYALLLLKQLVHLIRLNSVGLENCGRQSGGPTVTEYSQNLYPPRLGKHLDDKIYKSMKAVI